MSVHEHVDIKTQIIRLQDLYTRFLELKLRQPIADTGDRYQESLRTIQVAMDRGAEHTVGPLDRQISRPRKDALADGLSVNEESYNTANTLSIDSLVSIDRL